MEGSGRNLKSIAAFVILLVATVVWTLAWHQHMTAYNQMRKEEEEWIQKWLEEHEEEVIVDMLSLEKPFRWLFYGYGEFLVISGLIICVVWLFFLKEVFEEWRRDRGDENGKVEALKSLAYLAILMFFFLIVLYAPLIFRV